MTEPRSVAASPLLAVAALVVIFAGVKAAEQLMVPFLLAAFLATIAATPVFWLHARLKVPVGVAIAAVVLGLVGALLAVGALIAQSVAEFQTRLPAYQERLNALQQSVADLLSPLGIDAAAWPGLAPQQALGFAGEALLSLSNVLTNGFVILLAVIFILAEAYTFPRKLHAVLDDPARDVPHFERFAANVNRYIAIKTTVSLGTGTFVGLAMWIIGVDYPILWGVLAFLLNYVPTIGSVIAAVPPMLLAGLQLGAGGLAGVFVVFLVVNVVMGNVVETALDGARPGSFDAGGVPVPGVLELDARPGGHAALGAVDDDGEDRLGSQPLHGVDRPLAGSGGRGGIGNADTGKAYRGNANSGNA